MKRGERSVSSEHEYWIPQKIFEMGQVTIEWNLNYGEFHL